MTLRTVLTLNSDRSVRSSSTTDLVDAIRRGADLRIGTAFRRTDGQVERWRCDPHTLAFDRSTHRYDMRWFVSGE